MVKLAALLGIFSMSALTCLASSGTGAQKTDRSQAILDAVHRRLSDQGDVWFEKGEFPRIVQLLRVQNGLSPTDYDIATNLGWMLENIEQWNEALAVYVRYRKQNPKDPDSTYPEANFYFMKKAFAKVPPLLEPSLEKKPHANSYRVLAHAYERMSMFADSKRIWVRYLKRFPDDGAAKANLKRVEGKVASARK